MDKDKKIFLGLLLLDDFDFDFDKFKKDLLFSWGINATAYVQDNTLVFNVDEMTATIGFMDVAIPKEEIKNATAKNFRWEKGEDITTAHKAHLIVSVLGENTLINRGKLLVKLIATCTIQKNVIGVYSNGVVQRPQIYKAYATMMNDGLFPIHNLIWVGCYKTDNGISAYTYGMENFDKNEIEILDCAKELNEIIELLQNTCTYVIEDDATLKEGETIGYSETQKLPITFGEGVNINRKSLKIEF